MQNLFGRFVDTVVPTYHTDLRDAGDDELVDEVILSAHFSEEEINFLFIWNKCGTDESWIYGKQKAT